MQSSIKIKKDVNKLTPKSHMVPIQANELTLKGIILNKANNPNARVDVGKKIMNEKINVVVPKFSIFG